MDSHQSSVCEINKPKNELNILLLGETGVGKSTFINAFVNYLIYTKLEDAKNDKPAYLIPTTFTIEDENEEEHEVKFGDDENESYEVGQSATQSSMAYNFLLPDDTDSSANTLVRIIDTPGIADTRGIEQDKKNFEDILKFIDLFENLNAICIFLKPNQARITAQFAFCFKQLLSQLEKSACKNIVFVFTHTRGEEYKAGQTRKPLEKMLQQVRENQPGVQLTLNKSNMYCVDNEIIRFLLAGNIQFSEKSKSNFEESWERSRKEYLRLIKYIVGLEPHKVKNTISLNKARRTLDIILEPLAQIIINISDNLNSLNKKKKEIKEHSGDINDLNKRLYVPKLELKKKFLTTNNLVCTTSKCSKTYIVGENTKFYYPQKCCDDCRQNGHNSCGAFFWSAVGAFLTFGIKDVYCTSCGCAKKHHKIIRYEEFVAAENKIDDDVKALIEEKQTVTQKAEAMIQKLVNLSASYEGEKKLITESVVKFDYFIKNNAIVATNDSFKKYLEHCVENEKFLSNDGSKNEEAIKTSEEVLKEYEKKERNLDEIKKINTSESSVVSANDIFSLLDDLYRLEHWGMKIKESVIEREKLQHIDRIKRQKTPYVARMKANLLTGLFSK